MSQPCFAIKRKNDILSVLVSINYTLNLVISKCFIKVNNALGRGKEKKEIYIKNGSGPMDPEPFVFSIRLSTAEEGLRLPLQTRNRNYARERL